MIQIFKEDIFLKKAKKDDHFRPSEHGVILIEKGSINIELNGISITYKEQQIILISPRHIYKLINYSKDIEIFIILFNRVKIRKNMNFDFNRYEVYRIINSEKNHNRFPLKNFDFAFLIQVINQLLVSQEQENHSFFKQQITQSLVSVFIYAVMDSLVANLQSLNKISSRKEDITMKYIELATNWFKEERALEFYANKLFISPKYLSICVKEITNVPPSVIMNNIVINEAKILLLNSEYTISMIADEFNFSDQYSFGKFFKRNLGMSPTQFRKQNQLTDTL